MNDTVVAIAASGWVTLLVVLLKWSRVTSRRLRSTQQLARAQRAAFDLLIAASEIKKHVAGDYEGAVAIASAAGRLEAARLELTIDVDGTLESAADRYAEAMQQAVIRHIRHQQATDDQLIERIDLEERFIQATATFMGSIQDAPPPRWLTDALRDS